MKSILIFILSLMIVGANAQTIKINGETGTTVSLNKPGQSGNIDIKIPIWRYVCDYLYDAVASFSEETDVLNTGVVDAAELFGFKNNMQLTVFLNAGNSIPQVPTGKIQFGIYFPVDEWVRPGTSVASAIYDYDDVVWSETGATFYNSHGASVVAGNAKPDRYPNHGQEMYDLTNGGIGYDFVNGVAGASGGDEFFDRMALLQTYAQSKFGKNLSSGSYRFGQDEVLPMLLPYFLGLRNSDFPEIGSNGKTDYGQSNYTLNYLGLPQQEATRLDKMSAASTVRFDDMAGTTQQRLDYATEQVLLTIANKGSYNNFIHWHFLSSTATLDSYWNTVNTAIGSNFVWRCSYGEALEYLFLRELVTNVVITETSTSAIINISTNDRFSALTHGGFSQATPQELITVPISISVDLSNSSLAGSEIAVSSGTIRKVSTNNFVIQVPFTPNVGFSPVTITATGSPNYLNFNLPEITSSSNNGTTLQVVTDIPTKAVLYKVATGGEERNSVAQERSSTFSTTHNFNVTGLVGQDFRVGLISETSQSILSSVL